MNIDHLYNFELRLIARELLKQGYSYDDLYLAEHATDRARQQFPLRLSQEHEIAIYDHFATLNRNPNLSAIVGEALDITHYGEMGTLLAASNTVLSALHLLKRFQPLVTATLDIDVDEQPEAHYLRLSLPGNLTSKPSTLEAETSLISIHRIFEQITCNDIQWLACFAAGELDPEKKRLLENRLNCPVIDRVSHWGMMIRPSEAEKPLPLSRPERIEQLVSICDELVAEPASTLDIKERLQGYLKLLSPYNPSASAAAAIFNVSERQLSRKLKQQDTSWRSLVEAERQSRVINAFKQGRTNLYAAKAAGYTDVRALHLAVSRWFDTTPSSLRKRLQASGGVL